MTGRRTLEPAALAALAPVAALTPVWLAAVAVWWLPFRVWGDVGYPLFATSLLLLGVVLFSPWVERLLLTRLLGARTPRPDERARLRVAWSRVARRFGVGEDRFVLAIVDADEVNAFASGGHLLVVSSYAVRELDEAELAGVLAHELCHHLGSHTVALTVGQWMSLPIVALARIGFALQRVAEATADSFLARIPVLKFLALFVAAMLTVASSMLVAALLISQVLGDAVGHAAEYQADRRAAQVGFGGELLRALVRAHDARGDEPEERRGWVLASHPPLHRRIARLESYLGGVGRPR
jgi:Zn-dependent protease with chaperone function